MGQAIDEQPFPRGVLIAAAALITYSISVAAMARLTGTGATRAIPTEVVTERMVRLTLQKDGSVHASDAATGNDIAHLPQHEFGFVGVVLSGIRRERMRANVAESEPLRLTRHADGRLRIEDPSTGQIVSLDAFGYGNQAAFAPLLETQRSAQ
jgi:putative photosynthetic complex assembly protein